MKTFIQYLEMAADLSNRKQTLINQIHRKIQHLTRGIFSDNGWKPVHDIFQLLKLMGVDYTLMDAKYEQRPTDIGMPSSKRWKFQINFVNQNGKPDVIYGQIIASGAGSVADPLEKYDLTVTMS